MDIAEVERLIKGVGIIIDDDALDTEKMAYQLVDSIKSAGIPMAIYNDIPDVSVIDSFGNISFIILDWEFSKAIPAEFEGLEMGQEFNEDQKDTILSFLKNLLEKVFVPVFLITGQEFSTVKGELKEAKVYHERKPNRIMLKQKSEVQDYDSLLNSIKQWIENTPSAYALKQWESNAVKAKNRMFLELYNASPKWVNVLLNVLKEDADNNEKAVNHDFNNLINNNFVNRMTDGSYYNIVNSDQYKINTDEIRKVLQGERFITYDAESMPDVSYVGDLYKLSGQKYLLNIRAQCDLIRENDPDLYLLKGKVLSNSKITRNPKIYLKKTGENDKNYLTIEQQDYCIEDLLTYDQERLDDFNQKIKSVEKHYLFDNGEVIEKKTHSILACIAGKNWIEFRFRDFQIMKKSQLDVEAQRIGRILPPYITRVQNAFSYFMIREGQMPIPSELIMRSTS